MKYENIEFERNFQLKPTVQPTDEPTDSASNSVCAQSQTEKTHDDIQVFLRKLIAVSRFMSSKKFLIILLLIFLDPQGATIAWKSGKAHCLAAKYSDWILFCKIVCYEKWQRGKKSKRFDRHWASSASLHLWVECYYVFMSSLSQSFN